MSLGEILDLDLAGHPHQIFRLLSICFDLLCILTMFISGLVIFALPPPITGYSFNEIFKYIGEIPDLWLSDWASFLTSSKSFWYPLYLAPVGQP